MERILSKILVCVQIIFAVYMVAFAAFNLLRVVMGWHNIGIVVMFATLWATTATLLVLSIKEYQQLNKKEE